MGIVGCISHHWGECILLSTKCIYSFTAIWSNCICCDSCTSLFTSSCGLVVWFRLNIPEVPGSIPTSSWKYFLLWFVFQEAQNNHILKSIFFGLCRWIDALCISKNNIKSILIWHHFWGSMDIWTRDLSLVMRVARPLYQSNLWWKFKTQKNQLITFLPIIQ